jgi:hypothetical protein
MIEKLLDNYYFKKLKNKIERYMNIMYFLSLDYYVEYKDKHLYLYVKKVKYANYTKLLGINEDYLLSNLVNFKELCDSIDSYVSLYNEEEK